MFTVNNNKKREWYFRSLLIFIILISFCEKTNAQKISKYYTAMMQENGILYFIEPQHTFLNKKKHDKLSFDLTYLTTKDSVSLNFTYSGDTLRTIDSIGFFQDERFSSIVSKIFIEANNKSWVHRYSSKFAFNDIYRIYQQKNSPAILIYTDNKTIQLELKNSKWEKKSSIVSKILTLIKANKESP